jgi:hypothetical protein
LCLSLVFIFFFCNLLSLLFNTLFSSSFLVYPFLLISFSCLSSEFSVWFWFDKSECLFSWTVESSFTFYWCSAYSDLSWESLWSDTSIWMWFSLFPLEFSYFLLSFSCYWMDLFAGGYSGDICIEWLVLP